MTNRNFRLDFAKRLAFFICTAIICMLVASVLMAIVTHGSLDTPRLRVATVIQDLIMFVLPPVICAVVFTRDPTGFLCVERSPTLLRTVVAIAAMVCSIPAMNFIISANEQMHLPAPMSGVEEWMRESEMRAAEAVKMLMGGSGPGALLLSVMIVGILAGFSEEIFFRGGLQRILATRPMNPHIAIWTTAFIFSAIHVQFFGFFPRLLLGAFFGYLLHWSGSLWLPVICHTVNNSLVALATWLNSRGNDVLAPLNDTGTSPSFHWPWIVVSVVTTALLIYMLVRLREPKGVAGCCSR